MKKVITYLSITSSILFTSCTDVLDSKPLDLMTEDAIWSSVELAQANIYSSYGSMNYFHRPLGESNTRFGDQNADVIWTHWVSAGNKDDSGWSSSNDFGWDSFGDIRRANIAISKLKSPSVRADLGEENADFMLGQSYFLKGMTYYKQARKFGGWMIVDEPLDSYVSANELEKLQLKRATIQETYDYTISLFEEAAKLLPTEVKNGQINKAAALAMLTEVCLHGAAYMEYYENVDPTFYLNKVISAGEEIENMNKYSLVSGDDYSKMFSDYAYAQSCPEILLNYSKNSTYATLANTQSLHMLFGRLGSTWVKPGTCNLDFQPLNGYEASNGYSVVHPDPLIIERVYKIIDVDGKARRFEDSQLFRDNIEIVVEEDKYNPGVLRHKRKLKSTSAFTDITKLMFENRDARLDLMNVRDGSTYLGQKVYMRTGGNFHAKSSTSTNREAGTVTGFVPRKYLSENGNLNIGVGRDITMPVFRLARVYLNMAEAYINLNKDEKARQYLNRTRTKHGEIPALTTESGSELKMEYLDERCAELMLENDRYWTLLRTALSWGTSSQMKTMGVLGGTATEYQMYYGVPDESERGGIIPELNRGDNPTPCLEIEVPGNYMKKEDFFAPSAYFYRELYAPQGDHLFRFTPQKRYVLNIPQKELDQNPNAWEFDFKK